MTAFESYKKYVLQKCIVISVAVAIAFTVMFACLLPTFESILPNAQSETTVTQEAVNE